MFAGAACAVAVVLPGHAGAAGVSTTAQEECQGDIFIYELYAAGVSTTLSPANGAEVAEHSRVTFTGESVIAEPTPGHTEEIPLSFEIASSESSLSHPDIDSGAGAAGPGAEATRRKYTFTSTRAAAKKGTIYWQASFTRDLAACNHGEAHTFTTGSGFARPFRLTVVSGSPPCQVGHETSCGPHPCPAGSEAGCGPPPCQVGHEKGCGPPPCQVGHETSCSSPTPLGLNVGITAPRLIHIGHAAIAYFVSCSQRCSGQTYVKAWRLRGRRKPARASALDFAPRNVSISKTTGGSQRFVERVHGAALKKLRRMLRGGHEVKLVVTAKVKDNSGAGVQVQRTILLKG